MEKIDGILKQRHLNIGLSLEQDEEGKYLIKNGEMWAAYDQDVSDAVILQQADTFAALFHD